MVEWETITNEEPWFTLPADQKTDSLPKVLATLVAVALCRQNDASAVRDHVLAAAEHGRSRREQGFGQDLLLTEYYLLREAIWRFVRTTAGPSAHATQAILYVDNAISVATRASLQGYHQPELAAMGRWPEALETVARDSGVAGGSAAKQ